MTTFIPSGQKLGQLDMASVYCSLRSDDATYSYFVTRCMQFAIRNVLQFGILNFGHFAVLAGPIISCSQKYK